MSDGILSSNALSWSRLITSFHKKWDAFLRRIFYDLIYFYSIVKNAYYPYMINKLIPISFFLIALSLEGEDLEIHVETNKQLKNKSEDLSKISFELENRIIQRTRELETINKELIEAVNLDILTRLQNRTSFINTLDQMIEFGNIEFAVIFIDVDRFKTINDWYGHEVGDYILSQVARRIRKNLDDDLLSRLGGDEFGLVIKNFQDRLDVINFSNKILSDLIRPFITKERKIFITVSMGNSMYPEHAKTRSMLMKYADIALYKSKSEGKDRNTLYDLIMRKAENRRLEIENILYDAIEKNEISKMGIKIVLDKFGKGYSSFIHLKKLPIDKLKLDSEFIKNLDKEDDYKIVRAIMLMCKYMGVYSAAEEVSDNIQISILKDMECDFVQGDAYGRKMNLEEIENNYFNI